VRIFRWLLDKMEAQRRAQEEARASFVESLRDPVAKQVDWTPLKGGGTNFRTHNLLWAEGREARYRTSWGSKLFLGIFFVVGLGEVAGAAALGFAGEYAAAGMMTFMGLVFAGVAYGLSRGTVSPRVFDLQRRMYRTTEETPPLWPEAPEGLTRSTPSRCCRRR